MNNISMSKKITLYLMKKYFDLTADIVVERNETLNLNPPYLLLANHTNFWDPLIIAAYLKKPISFVASMDYFKKLSTRYLLKFADAIPKIKFIRDSSTIKEIINRKKEKKIIGIFPEGRRNWDGSTEKIIFSTAKLIKLLKIPVVLCSLKGAHLAQPRWSNNSRRGRISLSFKKILNRKKIKSMTVEEIYNLTQFHFKYDEYKYQEKKMHTYQGKKLAERLELFLFICPHCKSFSSLKSKNNLFFCQNCNYQLIYNNKGFFKSQNYKLYFNNTHDWNKWQLNYLEQIILNSKQEKILFDSNVKLLVNKNYKDSSKMKKVDVGKIYLTKKGFYFQYSTGICFKYEFDKIYGLNVHSNSILEFFYDNKFYMIMFRDRSTSAYKWLKGIELSEKLLLPEVGQHGKQLAFDD